MDRRTNSIVLALALAVTACGSSKHSGATPATSSLPPAPSAASTAATTTSTSVPPAPTAPGEPGAIVAVTTDQRVVAISPSTGEILRTLVPAQPGGGPSQLAMSPDHHTVWFSRGQSSCAAALATVPLAGGPENKIAGTGSNQADTLPALDPSGRLVAFSRYQCAANAYQVAVAPVTNAAQPVRTMAGVQAAGLAWSPDSALLAVGSASRDHLQLVSVSKTGVQKSLTAPDAGCGIDHPIFESAAPVLLVAESCQGSGKIIELDPASGSLHRTVVSLGPVTVASGFALDVSG